MPYERVFLTYDEVRTLHTLAFQQVRTPELVIRNMIREVGRESGFWPPSEPIEPVWIPELAKEVTSAR